MIAAAAPDRSETWTQGEAVVRAEVWDDLVLPGAAPEAPTLRLVALHDSRWAEPLVLASPLAVPPRALRDLHRDRWPVEQLPLTAKQLLGAARAFVSAPQTCQRLPKLALLAGAVLSDAAATAPAVPTGFWHRQPRPNPGRLRRRLGRAVFSTDWPLPTQIRVTAAVTAHLPTGF